MNCATCPLHSCGRTSGQARLNANGPELLLKCTRDARSAVDIAEPRTHYVLSSYGDFVNGIASR